MRASRIGSLLLGLGLLVGGMAAIAMTLGVRPSDLPANVLDIAPYKLAIAAFLGLLWTGGLVVRHGKRANKAGAASATGAPPEVAENMALSACEGGGDFRRAGCRRSPAPYPRHTRRIQRNGQSFRDSSRDHASSPSPSTVWALAALAVSSTGVVIE
ncbi:MAG: hypothetical protein ABIT38_12340 [Gemmatimonadaceae bacterium]